jgi:SAM-dependent methyltransferase
MEALSMSLFAQPRMVTEPGACFFYHTMDLPGLGVMPGLWDLRNHFDAYVGEADFAGKTVLDVGSSSGFLTFEAERRGGRVVSFDIADGSSESRLPFKDNLYYRNHPEWVRNATASYEPIRNAYWLAHQLYRSAARVYYGNIYQLPEELGQFDIVLVGSVMEHLSDPVSALASISKLTGSCMVVNTTLLDTDDEIARFEPSAETPENDYTWWVYSRGIYEKLFAMLGFEIATISWNEFYHARDGVWQPRATIVARRASNGVCGSGARRRSSRPYQSAQEEVRRLTAELAQTRARLAVLEALGPVTLGLAHRWRKVAGHYPRTFAWFRPVGRSMLRLFRASGF